MNEEELKAAEEGVDTSGLDSAIEALDEPTTEPEVPEEGTDPEESEEGIDPEVAYCGPNSEVCINAVEALEEQGSKLLDSSENITIARAALCVEQAETAKATKLKQLDY